MLSKYNKGLRVKAAVILALFLMLSLAGTSILSYLQSVYVAERKVIELEQSKFELLKHEIEGSLTGHKNILLSLSDVPPVQAILRARNHGGIDPLSQNSTLVWKKRLSTIFSAFLRHQFQYLQIRYIDIKGNVLVNVRSERGGDISITVESSSQNIAAPPYLTETLKLQSGQVYVSDVSLNREQGVIVTPHQPSLQLATPVYNDIGKLEALMVINLATNRLFSDVRSDHGAQRYIVDDRGNYIKHTDQTKEFGLDKGIDYRFRNVQPELSERADSLDHLIFHDNKQQQIIGFQKIYLNPEDKSRYWMITLHIPENVVFADITGALNKMLLISLVIGIVSLILAVWFVSRRIVNPVLNLAHAADKLQQGDLSVRVDETSVYDEFRTLYRAINVFADKQQNATLLLEKEVREQTDRLSTVINNVVDGIITIDDRGTVTSFNPAAERIFGYSHEQVIGRNVNMLMPEPYHSKHDAYVAHRVTTGEKKIGDNARELLGLRSDGSTFPLELAVTGVDIDNARHFVGITRDITERKRIEKLQREFISTVSHELRTPLTSISGSLGLILGGVAGELPEKAKSLLDIANNNCERLIQLINDILDTEKISAGKMQFHFKEANIIPVIRHAVEANRGYGKKLNVDFEFNAGADQELMVRIDEKRIGQVMSNLLSNAAKYSPTDDRVDITLEKVDDHVRISVHDNGKGIPEKFRPKIFNKFSQADSSDTREKGGTGLGLSITRSIVQSHSGEISFDCREGCGTTFYVDLPLLKKKVLKKKETVIKAADKPGLNQPLILIVEDDKDVSTLLGMMLSNAGYQFHQAYDYEEAMRHIELYQYDAVTLDLMIPGGSGISLLRELRNNKATFGLPVIVVSAKVHEGRLELIGDAFEMVDWLEKPIKETKLVELIKLRLNHGISEKAHILHVEDDPDITTIVGSLLGDSYQVYCATTLQRAQQLINEETFDLVLLDIGLPDGSGLELLKMLQAAGNPVPVVIFSAQDIPESIESQVMATLVKSKTDNEKLMSQIRSVINRKAG